MERWRMETVLGNQTYSRKREAVIVSDGPGGRRSKEGKEQGCAMCDFFLLSIDLKISRYKPFLIIFLSKISVWMPFEVHFQGTQMLVVWGVVCGTSTGEEDVVTFWVYSKVRGREEQCQNKESKANRKSEPLKTSMKTYMGIS